MNWLEKKVVVPVLGLFGDTSELTTDLSPKIDWSTIGTYSRLTQVRRANLFAGIAPERDLPKRRERK